MLPACVLLGVGLMFKSACSYGTHVCLNISFDFVFTLVPWMVLVSPVHSLDQVE